MVELKWSPEGRELLKIIKLRIQVYGGAEAVRQKIIKENRVTFRPPNISVPISENSIIFNAWNKYRTAQIAQWLGVSEATILRRAEFLNLGINKAKLPVNPDGENGKLVLNLETGIYYNSTVQAARSANINFYNLNQKLLGKRKNNTPFIRVE